MITRGLEKLRRLGLVSCLLVGAGPLSAVSVAEPFSPLGFTELGQQSISSKFMRQDSTQSWGLLTKLFSIKLRHWAFK